MACGDVRFLGSSDGKRRLPSGIHVTGSAICRLPHHSNPERPIQSQGASGRGSCLAREGGGCGDRGSTSRLLLHLLPDNKEVRGVEANHQSKTSQRVRSSRTLSNGNTACSTAIGSGRPMGSYPRPQRCLSSCPSPSRLTPMAEVQDRQSVVSVPCPPVRAVHFATGLHAHCKDRSGVLEDTGIHHFRLPGRLSYPRGNRRGSAARSSRRAGCVNESGVHHKRLQVETHSDSARSVLRCRSGLSAGHCHTDSGEGRVGGRLRWSSSGRGLRRSRIFTATSDRTHDQHDRAGSMVSAPYEAGSASSRLSLQTLGSSAESSRRDIGDFTKRPGLVGEPPTFVGRRTLPPAGSNPHPHDRCFKAGLGRAPRRPASGGSLDSPSQEVSHQRSRTMGSFPCVATLPAHSSGSPGSGPNGQRHGCLISCQARGYEEPVTVQTSWSSVKVVSGQGCESRGGVSPGRGEPSSRLSVKRRPGGSERSTSAGVVPGVAPSADSVPVPVCSLGTSSRRSVRCQTEPAAPDLFFVGRGTRGVGEECIIPGLVRNPRIRVPPHCSYPSGLDQDSSNQGLQNHPDSASLAASTMVCSSFRLLDRGTSPPACENGPAVDSRASSDRPVEDHNTPQAHSLDAFSRSYIQAGLSRQSATIAAQARRCSTRRTYTSRFNRFSTWCKSKACNPYTASVALVADFLTSVYVGGAQPRTIQGYRAAIGAIHHGLPDGHTIATSPIITQLIKGMFNQRPPVRQLLPNWDLPLVLRFVASFTHSNLDELNLLTLTKLTAFLLAVSCGRRCSEIHALSIKKEFMRFDQDGVTLLPRAGFLAKNQSLAFTPEPIFLPSLSKYSGVKRDCLVCPVRMLKFYLARTRALRGEVDQLFIGTKKPHLRVTKQTLSRWIVGVVKGAYKKFNIDLPSVHAHDTRALTASWALYSGVSIDNIIGSVGWRRCSTFQNTYLRDVPNRPLRNAQTAVAALRAGSRR